MLQAVHSHITSKDALTNDRLVQPRRSGPGIGPRLEDCSGPGRRQLADHLAKWFEGDVAEGYTRAELGDTPANELGDRVGVEAGFESFSDEPLELEGGPRDEGDVGLDGLVDSTRTMEGERSSVREAERGFLKNCSEGKRVPVGRAELARQHPGHREELVGVVLEGGEVSSPGGQVRVAARMAVA